MDKFELIKDLKIKAKIVIAEKEMQIKDVLNLDENSILDFPNKAISKAYLYVDDIKIAEGDVIVNDNDEFGIRITKICNNSTISKNDIDEEVLKKELKIMIENLTGVQFKFEKENQLNVIKGLKYIIGNMEIIFPCEFVTKIVDLMFGGTGEEKINCEKNDITAFNEIIFNIIKILKEDYKNNLIFEEPIIDKFNVKIIYKYDNKIAFGIRKLGGN